MKRRHGHVDVNDLAQSIRFYSTLFMAEPNVINRDYVKWMLDDPRVNFAISSFSVNGPGGVAGISYLGTQAEDEINVASFTRGCPTRRARSSRSRERSAAMRNRVAACCVRRSSPTVSRPSTERVRWQGCATRRKPTAASPWRLG